MAAATPSPTVDLTSDHEENENAENSPPWAKRVQPFRAPPGSRQSPPASSGRSSNHPTPATASAPSALQLIEVEELGNSIRTLHCNQHLLNL